MQRVNDGMMEAEGDREEKRIQWDRIGKALRTFVYVRYNTHRHTYTHRTHWDKRKRRNTNALKTFIVLLSFVCDRSFKCQNTKVIHARCFILYFIRRIHFVYFFIRVCMCVLAATPSVRLSSLSLSGIERIWRYQSHTHTYTYVHRHLYGIQHNIVSNRARLMNGIA